MDSALYLGTLRHRRFRTKRHDFTYPIFMPFLDIDLLPQLMNVSPFTSYNRWNWASYCERDHFGDHTLTMRERLMHDASAHGVTLPDGKIFLLTHLRYLGYNFNPVSFFYCYDRQENLQAVLAEVNNTFAETHNYWLSKDSPICQPEIASGSTEHNNALHFCHPKKFHVSPFLDMQCDYRWTFTPPAEQLIVQQSNVDQEGVLFDATLKLNHRPWSAAEIQHTLLAYPWHTLKVVASIHWQAIRLWSMGVPVVRHPGPGKFDPAPSRNMGASWSNR
jgi:DUF1365 family protein